MEAKLTELVTRMKAAAEANLKSIVLYGSAVTAEFRAGHSDLNILCIVERAAAEDLEHLHDAAEWWVRQGNPPPLLFTLDELHKSADVFAIELLDITSHPRLLFGTDYFSNFEVPLRLHRLQVERELRADWLRLRQSILAAPLSYKAHLGIMTQSLSTFCSLFRHALFALGQPMPATKREAVAASAALTASDPSAFQSLLDVREDKRKQGALEVEASLRSYLKFVEAVTSEVDRR